VRKPSPQPERMLVMTEGNKGAGSVPIAPQAPGETDRPLEAPRFDIFPTVSSV
jgi:hypothetical protein